MKKIKGNFLSPIKRHVMTILIGVLGTANVQAEPLKQDSFFCGEENPVVAQDPQTLILALYDIVSGEAGAEKDWQLMRNLFAPNGIVTPVFHDEERPQATVSSVDEFIALNQQIFKNINFYETELKHISYRFGHMATVLSHYESRDDLNAAPYSQGINSFQLLNDGRRWCVVSATWDSDKGGHTINADTLSL